MADEQGLYAIVRPNGNKWWRFDYTLNGRRNTMSFGVYPDVSLAQARALREQCRKKVAAGVDPVEAAKGEKALRERNAADTFARASEDYIQSLREKNRAASTIKKHEWLLQDLARPLAKMAIRDITAADILPLLKKIEARGNRDTAHTLRATLGSVFRFCVYNLRADNDPTFALRGALLPVEEQHHAAITDEKEFGGLLRAIDEFDGWPTLKVALQIMALCYPRPVELRHAEWGHFDFKEKVWTIPEHLAKMRRPHDIPLSSQALTIIQGLKPISGDSQYVFPSLRSLRKVISENGMNSALRRMGYMKEEHTSHGFRASASSILNQRKYGFHPDVIERSLAHIDKNQVRRAYNRHEYWDERVVMAQAWADICDALKLQKRRDNDDLI